MECVNKNKNIPRIVRGNSFVLNAKVTHPVLDKDGMTVQEDFDLSKSMGISVAIVSRYGARKQMAYTVNGSILSIPFDGTVKSGVYGLEVTGKDATGNSWRFYARPDELLEIVEPTSEAYIPQDDTVEGYYSVELNIGVVQVATDLMEELKETTEKAKEVASTKFEKVGNKMYIIQNKQ